MGINNLINVFMIITSGLLRLKKSNAGHQGGMTP
jgi:hypothetical protein